MSRTEQAKHYALAILLPMLLMAGVTYGVGKAILAWPTGEASVSRSLAADRTSLWNGLTDFGSSLSDTPYIVALTVMAAIVFRRVYRRWRESIFLVAAVWSQSLIFLATTGPVGRQRPPVQHLDEAPPTSSFPSGHVSAAVAFYCGMALLLTAHVRSRALQVLIWVLGIAAPLAVGFSRLYRGMHFLTDVLWGVLLGVGCVVMAARAILYARQRQRQRSELVRSA
ncbi:phosphatase PAP2 family protein [Nonomuraea turkmeniaca]|uniref:Phosphatase PAP2 family protein n=1 Tax=Nonomuraea turkmeniaca TaxID=103838 RepID=A0A5S4FAK4_9ACTN|nr:phosphatase PAP2 family protein [Nonomuraea turkmeniaca]TMR14351.1 phosphatase PAP2 family protein [Nonomuraea turkmeniaca]